MTILPDAERLPMPLRFCLLALLFCSTLTEARAQPSGLQADVAGVWTASEYELLLHAAFVSLREDPEFDGRFTAVVPPLVSASGADPSCSDRSEMLLITSFYPIQPERYASLCRSSAGYRAESGVPGTSFWAALHDHGGWQQALREVRIKWDVAPLDTATAMRIGDVWTRAIQSAASFEPHGGAISDGKSALFRRSFVPLQPGVRPPFRTPISASALSTQPGTVAEAFQALGQRLGAFARGEATRADLLADAGVLSARLDALDR